MKLDRPVPGGVQRQKRGRCVGRRGIVEPTGDEHDAAREELLLQPIPEAHASSVQRATTREPSGARGVQRVADDLKGSSALDGI